MGKGKTRLEKIKEAEERPKTEKTHNLMRYMAMESYELWYKKDVAPHLNDEQKDALIKRISDLTLEEPIWLDSETNYIANFPELEPYSHTKRISGLQLCAVMEVIFNELHPDVKFSLKNAFV